MRGRVDPRRVALAVAAPVIAIAFALIVTAIVLKTTGDPVWGTAKVVWNYGKQPRVLTLTLNQTTTYYLSALAVAIGFRMNLFNIGVDGQYRLAAFSAAAIGATFSLPKPLHIFVIVVVAMCVGAMWAGVAALLKVQRGVSEVISTIMLNAIATSLVAYLLRKVRVDVAGSNNTGTKPLSESAHMPGLALIPDAGTARVFGFIVIAVLAGIGYSVLLGRTRFGFDLRATGRSETAAVASGVNVKRMVLYSMLLSGAVAGLVGMPQLLGASYSYSLDFPTGLGFTGIAIALLGRNNAVGMAFAAFLWAFLDSTSVILDINNVSKEIVLIMQGTVVLSVVVVYELVRRYGIAAEQRRVSRELAQSRSAEPEAVTA